MAPSRQSAPLESIAPSAAPLPHALASFVYETHFEVEVHTAYALPLAFLKYPIPGGVINEQFVEPSHDINFETSSLFA